MFHLFFKYVNINYFRAIFLIATFSEIINLYKDKNIKEKKKKKKKKQIHNIEQMRKKLQWIIYGLYMYLVDLFYSTSTSVHCIIDKFFLLNLEPVKDQYNEIVDIFKCTSRVWI